ncbi:MAG: hypothetical protein QW548_03210 [Candidatus Aenigmatarchaeota archaeon]
MPFPKAITAKILELDVSQCNTYFATQRLVELLRKKRLFHPIYLYRGTDEQEIWLMAGAIKNAARNVEGAAGDSIECYTAKDLQEIANDSSDRISPITYAIDNAKRGDSLSDDPVIAVLKASELEYAGERSNYEYRFKRPNEKLRALAAVVRLKF